MTLPRLARLRPAWFAGCLWLTLALPALAGGFTATLSAEKKASAGLDALSAQESEALDRLVAEDLAYALREKLTELPGTFAGRRADASRRQTGIDKLTAGQLAKLNEIVATVLAALSLAGMAPLRITK